MTALTGSTVGKKIQRAWIVVAVETGRGPLPFVTNSTIQCANLVLMECSRLCLLNIMHTSAIHARSVGQTVTLLPIVLRRLTQVADHAQEECLLMIMERVWSVHSARKTHQYKQ